MNYQVVITYRKTRRLSMRVVKNGDIHVSAPLGINKAEVYEFIEKNQDWISDARERKLQSENKRYNFFNQLKLDTKEKYIVAIQRLDSIVAPLVEKYAKQMDVSPNKIYYRAVISRWGCCQIKSKEIYFSIYLLLLPEWCIEHIVVHELAHLLVPNHSKRFYEIMDIYFPLWKKARKETKRIFRMEES